MRSLAQTTKAVGWVARSETQLTRAECISLRTIRVNRAGRVSGTEWIWV